MATISYATECYSCIRLYLGVRLLSCAVSGSLENVDFPKAQSQVLDPEPQKQLKP